MASGLTFDKIKHMKTWVEISKNSLKHNIKIFDKLLAPGVRFMAVVKSNAYGHGLLEVSKIVSKLNMKREIWFGVDSIGEGIALRKAGIKKPILVLGYAPKNELTDALKADIRLTVYNEETVRLLARAAKKIKKTARIHIKIETGATRQGVNEQDLPRFARLIKSFPSLVPEGISTHFANIEDIGAPHYAKTQLSRFRKAIRVFEKQKINIPIRHTACSAAAILFPDTHFNMARIGISLYGLWSSQAVELSAKTKVPVPKLKPVLTWKTVVAQIKNVPAGTPVGYGLTEKTARKSKIAVLPIGYYDGYDRRFSSIGSVLLHGVRCKIMGRVCMNMIMVDATDVPGVHLEDTAVLIGQQKKDEISAEELALKIGTINYEIVTRINPLLPRLLV